MQANPQAAKPSLRQAMEEAGQGQAATKLSAIDSAMAGLEEQIAVAQAGLEDMGNRFSSILSTPPPRQEAEKQPMGLGNSLCARIEEQTRRLEGMNIEIRELGQRCQL